MSEFDTEFSRIATAIYVERCRQEKLLKAEKFPFSCDSVEHSDLEKLPILAEEFGEVSKEVSEYHAFLVWYRRRHKGLKDYVPTETGLLNQTSQEYRRRLKAELIQVAAVCVGWVQALNQRIE